MFIYSQARVGVPVQVYVIGSIIFLVAVGLVALTTLAGRRQKS
jgi:ABC-type spermidine/putrescine transport system permease subunit II